MGLDFKMALNHHWDELEEACKRLHKTQRLKDTMLKKRHEQIQVCTECHDYIQGNWSAFDYYGTTDLRLEELEVMHKEFTKGAELLFTFIVEEEFSAKECEICLSRLAGKRFSYQVWEQQKFVPSNQTINFNLE